MIWRALSLIDRLRMRRAGGAFLNTLRLYGTYRCAHRSHRLRLRCYRSWTWDRYCPKHNESCWNVCPGTEGP